MKLKSITGQFLLFLTWERRLELSFQPTTSTAVSGKVAVLISYAWHSLGGEKKALAAQIRGLVGLVKLLLLVINNQV